MIRPGQEFNDERNFTDNKELNSKKRPILLFVPGMNGTSDQLYSFNMAKACIENNYDCVVVNYRGLAGVPLTVSENHLIQFFVQ